MTSESQLEQSLLSRLHSLGWEPVSLPNEVALLRNLKSRLEIQNSITLTDEEFGRVLNHLDKGSVFERAQTLRDRFRLVRIGQEPAWIGFLNQEHWCRNQYQVASQISLTGNRENRYDVTLLINGFPLCQIELKRPGVELKQAFNQINRYQRDSFAAARGLFLYTQIFVISNGVNTRYFSNNRNQSFKQTFTWSDAANVAINRLEPFTDIFLDKCQISKMISRYIVLHGVDKSLMILRPYQYFAAERILDQVKAGRSDGYIWHTTGSGKTLTSFKAAQNILTLPKIRKVLFVVDRADLNYQTIQEFNNFRKGSVDATEDTRMLVSQLRDDKTKLVITTIQKLNAAISNQRHVAALEKIRDDRVVLIFDECHRSQFGETHQRIKGFFRNNQMFGFTGTPIFRENAVGMRGTRDLFGERLHEYIITDAIRDENVLRFSVEYLNNPLPGGADLRDYEAHPDRIRAVVDWIIDNHGRKTRGRRFGSIFAISSVDTLCSYYDELQRRLIAGEHDLSVATIFTYAPNEDDPDATDLIPDTDFPGDTAGGPKRDRLARYVKDYNTLFGTNESVRDGAGFYSYYQSLAKRMKARDRQDFSQEQGIDILLVVNMFLTGFDVKTLNTLYVDKNLRHHGLIQAFSRTNRTLGEEKSQGNIVCFRDLKVNTDAAIALFADPNASEVVLIGSYEDHLEKYRMAYIRLKSLVQTPDDVDLLPDEEAQAAFVRVFRDILRLGNVLSTFSEYSDEDLSSDPQEMQEYKSKYLDLAGKNSGGREGGNPGPLEEIYFELELLRTDEINLTYILNLLGPAGRIDQDDMRRRALDLISSEIGLREKRPYLEEFLNQVLPALAEGSDIREAFDAFWVRKRREIADQICKDEDLDAEKFDALIAQAHFSGKFPISDEICDALVKKPGIMMRQEIVVRVSSKLKHLMEVFDDQ